MLQAATLWIALLAPATATRRGVNLWDDPRSFKPASTVSFSDAVHGKENMVLSTYRERLLNMGQTLGTMVAPPPTTPPAEVLDPEVLRVQIKATVHADDPFQDQRMKATEKATEDNMLGLSSLREEISNVYHSPAPAPAPKENPFWQQNYSPTGHERFSLSLKQQFAFAGGDVYQKYQQKLRGATVQQTSPKEDAPRKKTESANVDTLLGVASSQQENVLMEKEAQVLARSFESESKHSDQSWGAPLPYYGTDSAVPSTGELTTAEAQQWQNMIHPAPAPSSQDHSQDYPFVPVLPAHEDAPPPLPDTPVAPPSRPKRSYLWDPPSQANDEIVAAHGSVGASEVAGSGIDLWKPHHDGLVQSLEKQGLSIPTSGQQWGDVFKQYQSRVHEHDDQFDLESARLENAQSFPQGGPHHGATRGDPHGQVLDDRQKFSFAASLFSPPAAGAAMLNSIKTSTADSWVPNRPIQKELEEPEMPKPLTVGSHLTKPTWNDDHPFYDTHWVPKISLSQLTGQPDEVAKQEQSDSRLPPAPTTQEREKELGLTQLKKTSFQVQDQKVDSQDKMLQNVLSDLPEDPMEAQSSRQRPAVTATQLWDPHASVKTVRASAFPQMSRPPVTASQLWDKRMVLDHQTQSAVQQVPFKQAYSEPAMPEPSSPFNSLLSSRQSLWTPPARSDIPVSPSPASHNSDSIDDPAMAADGMEPSVTSSVAQLSRSRSPQLNLQAQLAIPAQPHVATQFQQPQAMLQQPEILDPAMATDGMEPPMAQQSSSQPAQLNSKASLQVSPLFKSLLSSSQAKWTPPAVPDILQGGVADSSVHSRSAVTRGQLWDSKPLVAMPVAMQQESLPALHLPPSGQRTQAMPEVSPVQAAAALWGQAPPQPAVDLQPIVAERFPPHLQGPPPSMEPPVVHHYAPALPPQAMPIKLQSQGYFSEGPVKPHISGTFHVDALPPQEATPTTLQSQEPVTPETAAAVLFGALKANPNPQPPAAAPFHPQPTLPSTQQAQPILPSPQQVQLNPSSNNVVGGSSSSAGGMNCNMPDPPPPCPWIAPGLH